MAEYADDSPIVLPDDPSLGPEVQIDYPGYRSTRWRAPKRPLVSLPEEFHDLDGPVFGDDAIERARPRPDARSTRASRSASGSSSSGTLLDEDGRPLPGALIEIWQANAAGATTTIVDQHPAPLDPNFSGAGRCLTDAEGRYRFVTIKPGAYPWGNHENAWRPAHIHFSVFGSQFTQRLVTQMYFPGDPLFAYDPIFTSVRDPKARELLVSRFDIETTQPEWALALRLGHRPRPRRERHDADGERAMTLPKTASQTVGPYYTIGLSPPTGERARRSERRRGGAADRAALRRPGRADQRRHDRDLGRGRRALGPERHRRRRPLLVRRDETERASRARRRGSTSSCSRAGCCGTS